MLQVDGQALGRLGPPATNDRKPGRLREQRPCACCERVALLLFVVSLAGGCGTREARHDARTGGAAVESAAKAPVVSPAVLKVCGSHADFGVQYSGSWVEDRRQQLCCGPRAEGIGSHFSVWRFVAPEACVSRYAPGLILPFVVTADSTTNGADASAAEDCLPGVAAEVLIPTAELEAQLEYGSRLRIESCVGSKCAQAVIEFDSLARDDQLLFALDGSSKAGALLFWNAGMVRFRLRVVQPREEVVEAERYRLTLELDGKSLRAVDTALSYDSSRAVAAPGSVAAAQCPVARVSFGAP
ncbi:MAG TPA: hypothetical protein VGC79_35635 [Polyangiaceae bacterium]